ncbi:Amino-transferase class IV [Actinomadura madurae]|uniref:Amino-transferase class IV n=1 Tax=Actinomadura madurae TaxID=1993 RepID=A0A1I5G7H8_9ACTN|nr:aminotransferase class IV [Actinomadura madurae]SFO31799.1 Amino-transferase class IV [Actinomadura madurae]
MRIEVNGRPATAEALAHPALVNYGHFTAMQVREPVPHIRHVGGFGQIHFGLKAQRAGFDDALLVLRDGRVAEGGITNIGFFRDGGVVTNSLGIAPVTRIGDVTYPVSDLMASADKAYASVPWGRI